MWPCINRFGCHRPFVCKLALSQTNLYHAHRSLLVYFSPQQQCLTLCFLAFLSDRRPANWRVAMCTLICLAVFINSSAPSANYRFPIGATHLPAGRLHESEPFSNWPFPIYSVALPQLASRVAAPFVIRCTETVSFGASLFSV